MEENRQIHIISYFLKIFSFPSTHINLEHIDIFCYFTLVDNSYNIFVSLFIQYFHCLILEQSRDEGFHNQLSNCKFSAFKIKSIKHIQNQLPD